jgi:hypothetical protein
MSNTDLNNIVAYVNDGIACSSSQPPCEEEQASVDIEKDYGTMFERLNKLKQISDSKKCYKVL